MLDGQEITNHDDAGVLIVIDGVSTTPSPYNGQFIQMEVVGITQVP